MSSDSQYLVTPSDRMTLLQDPPGAVLMPSSNQMTGRLPVLEHSLTLRGHLARPPAPTAILPPILFRMRWRAFVARGTNVMAAD
jgi:hypothetical protein